MPSGYSLPKELLAQLGLALLTDKRRSFRADAMRCASLLQPPLKIYGAENIPASGPCLVTPNHYARPGFHAWWLALAVSAVVPAEVHWLITSAWTYPDRLRSATITPVSRWVLKRLGQVYRFTNLPPMPPDPAEVLRRAKAVRRVLKYARQSERPLIGLAPEGGDFAAPGRLAEPPRGVGRFISHLEALGLEISPVGIFEEGECLCLRFGSRYHLEVPPGLPAASRDSCASQQVMQRIAELIPELNMRSAGDG
jgi:1-acyl-sn-glycerol-3-phosphate acyltransferase